VNGRRVYLLCDKKLKMHKNLFFFLSVFSLLANIIRILSEIVVISVSDDDRVKENEQE
jgi:hypothetical protein